MNDANVGSGDFGAMKSRIDYAGENSGHRLNFLASVFHNIVPIDPKAMSDDDQIDAESYKNNMGHTVGMIAGFVAESTAATALGKDIVTDNGSLVVLDLVENQVGIGAGNDPHMNHLVPEHLVRL